MNKLFTCIYTLLKINQEKGLTKKFNYKLNNKQDYKKENIIQKMNMYNERLLSFDWDRN